jgi:GH25 family lysozyme M1 (1,4-beta-N-acetylmuramidase)
MGLCAGCLDPETSSIDQPVVACAAGPIVKGIDVSYYEASVDWPAVHAAGVDFTFIRATDGLQYIDPTFPGYWDGAKSAGVIRGAYQFFRPAEDPVAQADLLLSKIGTIEPGDLPPVIDVEVSGGLTTAQVAAAVHAWVDRVTAAIGRPPIVYAGLYSWHDLTANADLTSSPLWVAQYTSAACPDIPAPWTQWRFWQDSSTGSVDGIPGSTLDLDVFDGTLDDLRAFTIAGTCGDGVCSGGETTATCAGDCPPCGTIPAAGGEIDDGDRCFVAGGPASYLRDVASAGEQGDLVWTHATDAAAEANFAQWNLDLEAGGRYRVEVYTAQPWAQSTRAAYAIVAAGATTTVVLDQSAADGWQSLGELDFAAGAGQWIHLGDNTGEAPSANVQLVFDAVRLVPVDPSPPTDDAGGCASTRATGAAMLVVVVVMGWGCPRRKRPTARRPR